MPNHVAIIMDGNGRWAKQRGLARTVGHKAGVEALHPIISSTAQWGIKTLTIFAFSTENWSRPAAEVAALMGFIEEYFQKQIASLHKQGVRICIIGQRENVPPAQLKVLDRAVALTRENETLTLNIAFNYGAQREIALAAREIARQAAAGRLNPDDVDEVLFESYLQLPGPPVDLMIRTSGELRLSNFLLYQMAYAELAFPKVYWPDFDTGAYRQTIEDYMARNRRFGKIS
jgi:undecaprenyl diphosphate synthase